MPMVCFFLPVGGAGWPLAQLSFNLSPDWLTVPTKSRKDNDVPCPQGVDVFRLCRQRAGQGGLPACFQTLAASSVTWTPPAALQKPCGPANKSR
jgi:hypothetical protein